MSRTTFPRPTSFKQYPHLTPRPLLLIRPPPVDLLRSIAHPQLPAHTRTISPNCLQIHGYTYTTHLIPSAYPRSSPDISEPTVPRDGETKEKRKERVKRWTEEILETKARQERGEILGEGSREVLWNCLGRYVRTGDGERGVKGEKRKGVTLFCAHANGMNKEVSPSF